MVMDEIVEKIYLFDFQRLECGDLRWKLDLCVW